MNKAGGGRYAFAGLRLLARVIAARKLRLSVTGLEHIPLSGPVIIACHHYHHLYDGTVLLATATRPLQILVGLDWARLGPVRWAMEAACRLAGWPTILRPDQRRTLRTMGLAGERASYRAHFEQGLGQSLAILRTSGALVVFPEGHPTIDPHPNPKRGELVFLPFKRGFADLAVLAAAERNAELPVVPVCFRYRPQGPRWQVDMEVGVPRWVRADDSPLIVASELEATIRGMADTPRFKHAAEDA